MRTLSSKRSSRSHRGGRRAGRARADASLTRLASAWLAALLGVAASAPPTAAAQFPQVPVVDDFERPDGPLYDDPRWAEAWRFYGGNEADRTHVIVAGQIASKAGGGSPAYSGASAWLPLVAADVEAYVTWSALPVPPAGTGRGSEIQVRTQSLPNGHLHYYSCEMYVNATPPDEVYVLWQQGEGVQQRAAHAVLSDAFAAGDVVGARIVGERLECWRVHATAGGGFQPGDVELMVAADVPFGLGPGYVVLRTTDSADIRWDDFGVGRFPPPPPVPMAGPLAHAAAEVSLAAAALLLGRAVGSRRSSASPGAGGPGRARSPGSERESSDSG